jgi:hypothetical protein
LHEAGQVLHVFDWCFWQDTVTEIKDVAGASGGAAEDLFRARF